MYESNERISKNHYLYIDLGKDIRVNGRNTSQ